MPQVKISIKPRGNAVAVVVNGEGFTGKACDGVLERFVLAAGGKADCQTELKPEYAMDTATQFET